VRKKGWRHTGLGEKGGKSAAADRAPALPSHYPEPRGGGGKGEKIIEGRVRRLKPGRERKKKTPQLLCKKEANRRVPRRRKGHKEKEGGARGDVHRPRRYSLFEAHLRKTNAGIILSKRKGKDDEERKKREKEDNLHSIEGEIVNIARRKKEVKFRP